VIIVGTSPDTLTRFIYAALARLNETKNIVIYILEQQLSFLLKHRNSIVVQVEVGTDIPTLTEGIRNGLFLKPDLVYISNPKTPDEFAGLMCAAQSGATVLIGAIAINQEHLLNDLKKRLPDDFSLLRNYIRKTINVSADPAGLITLTEPKFDPQ